MHNTTNTSPILPPVLLYFMIEAPPGCNIRLVLSAFVVFEHNNAHWVLVRFQIHTYYTMLEIERETCKNMF